MSAISINFPAPNPDVLSAGYQDLLSLWNPSVPSSLKQKQGGVWKGRGVGTVCRVGVRRGDVGAPNVWVLRPLASEGRAGFSVRTDTWTGIPSVEEWRKQAGVAQLPGCPTRRDPAPPMVEAQNGGEQNWPGGLKGQTPGSHRPPAKVAAVNGIMGNVVRRVWPHMAVSPPQRSGDRETQNLFGAPS